MRRRFIQCGLELVEVPIGAAPPSMRADSGILWGDRHYANLRATDGTPIDSRTRHREFMRSRGLTTADDFSGHWNEARQQRDAFYTNAPDPTRREDVARAVEKHRG